MLDMLMLLAIAAGIAALVRWLSPSVPSIAAPDDAVPAPEPAKKGIDWTMWIVAFVFAFLFTFANMGGR